MTTHNLTVTPELPTPPPLASSPLLTHSVLAQLLFLLFLKYTSCVPASGPLNVLFPLPGMFSADTCVAGSLASFWGLPSIVTFP